MDILGLSDKQIKFVGHVSNGYGIANSGRKAGYSQAARTGAKILSDRTVQKMIRTKIESLVKTDGLAAAYRYIRRTIDDERAPHQVRVKCAQIMIESAGLSTYKAREHADERDEKDVNDMSPDELRAFIAAAEERLSAEAKDISQETLALAPPIEGIEDYL